MNWNVRNLGPVALAVSIGMFAFVAHSDPIDTSEIDLAACAIDRTDVSVTESTNPKSSYEAYHVLDGGLDDSHRWISSSNKGNLVFTFPSNVVVNAIGVQAPAWAADSRSPRDWTFSGSADGETWVELDSQSGQTGWTGNLLRVYSFTNKTPYRYFKFDITKNNGDGACSLAEFWFYDISLSHILVESSEGVRFGTVSPAWGSSIQTPGRPLACSAYDSLDRDGDGRFVTTCRGYDCYQEVDGEWSCLSAGTGHEFAFDEFPDSDVKLVWRMETVVSAAVTTVGSGTVSGAGDYAYGSAATFEASPADGYVFRRWTGLPQGVEASGTRIVIPMTNVVSLTAVFEAASSVTRYVATTGDDGADGSASAPFASIKRAIADLGANGGIVYVAAGTYSEAPILNDDGSVGGTNTVVLSTPVQIVGQTGDPADVIVQRANTAKNARVFLLDHAEAALRFLTVSGGKYDRGGNVQITDRGGRIEDCILTGGQNESYVGGGANLNMACGHVSRCVLCNGTGQSNNYGSNGGGFWMSDGVIENCLVVGNSGRYAGGVVSGSGRLVNCTIVANRFDTVGFSAGLFVSADARVVNCVIAENTNAQDASMTGLVYSAAAKANVTNVFVNCASSEGGVPINPTCHYGPIGFADSASGDYSPSVSSALRDFGVPAEDYGITSLTDLAGNPRLSGRAIDVGCYEFAAGGFSCEFTMSAASHIVPAAIALVATVEGEPESATYSWEMDDGVPAHRVEMTSETPSCTWTCAYPGTYTVTLTVTAEGRTASAVHDIQTSPAVLYVDAACETPAYPYDTPETASTDLGPALAAAMDGAVVRLAAGEYVNASETVVEKAVSVLGESRETTRLVSAKGRTLRIIHADALVANLSLESRDGGVILSEGGCVYITGTGGTLSNCLVRCHSVGSWGRGGSGISSQYGHITHCEIYGNASYSTGDAWNNAIVRLRNGSRMENSLVRDVVATVTDGAGGHIVSVEGSSAVNCTIVRCTLGDPAKGSGQGYGLFADSGSTVRNCAVVGVGTSSDELRPYGGTPESFDHCAFDGDTKPDDTCRLVTGSVFRSYAEGDFRPAPGRELIDGGAVPDGWRGLTDLSGKPRVKGRTIDIGCFEGNASGLWLHVR